MRRERGRLMLSMNQGIPTTIITTTTKYTIMTSPGTIEVQVELQIKQRVIMVRTICTQIAVIVTINNIESILIPTMLHPTHTA